MVILISSEGNGTRTVTDLDRFQADNFYHWEKESSTQYSSAMLTDGYYSVVGDATVYVPRIYKIEAMIIPCTAVL